MTRIEQISYWARRYELYSKLGKRRKAADAYVTLKTLTERQLRAELRQARLEKQVEADMEMVNA